MYQITGLETSSALRAVRGRDALGPGASPELGLFPRGGALRRGTALVRGDAPEPGIIARTEGVPPSIGSAATHWKLPTRCPRGQVFS